MSRGMHRDPLVDVAEQVAEQARDINELEGRVDAHGKLLRPNQAETVAQAGLPADLVAAETSVWKRLTPGRNPWPQVAEFDERVAELEQRQAAAADELRELHERKQLAPERDHDRLAEWELADRKGPRPEPELPAIDAAIERLQAEWEGLSRATQRVLDDKAQYVEEHRARLSKEADGHVDETHRRYLELVDELASVREDLFGKRRAAVWARLYPGEQSAREVPDTCAGGRKRPLQAMGAQRPRRRPPCARRPTRRRRLAAGRRHTRAAHRTPRP
jgi:hypothetical protein